MINNEILEIIREIFEQAYQLGKSDGLEGVHFCPKEQYSQFLERELRFHHLLKK